MRANGPQLRANPDDGQEANMARERTEDPMYEVPLSRLHALRDAERDRDRYLQALRVIAESEADNAGVRLAREVVDGA